MATTHIGKIETNKCPRCNTGELLKIEGSFVKWFKCPKCKFTKIIEKREKEPIKVVPLIEKEEPNKIRIDVEK